MADVAPDDPNTSAPAVATGVSRRRVLQGAGVAAALAATAGGSAAEAAAAEQSSTPPAAAGGFAGTMADLKHVVILMQENRSFDHYFGKMPGVRGFDDKQALRFPDGTSVFQQRDAGGNIHTPQEDDSAWGTNHDFTTLNGRRWNTWVREKGVEALNYHSPAYMSFYWSVASQFGIGDQYFCSINGPTDCNRKYHWSGMSNGEIGNSDESNYDRDWITVAEQLQEVGIDWRMYSDNSGSGAGGRQAYRSDWFGDYGDNELKYFRGFEPKGLAADDPKLAPGTGLIWRGNAQYYRPDPGSAAPNNDSAQNLEYVLRDFIDACKPGAEHPLPAVSWITAPYGWSEHPSADSMHGERFVERILRALQDNEELWNSTLFILNYDENDGKFDHVLPPFAEPGTPGEYTNGKEQINVSNIVTEGGSPIGLGARVPLLLVSPWTRGGWVASEVFDHTSVIKLLETWAAFRGTPFMSPNISDWRRAIVGDLTSALDFAHPQTGPVRFADPTVEVAVPVAADHMKHRPLPFHGHATLAIDRAAGSATATMTVDGPAGKALGFQIFPDRLLPFSNTPKTVPAGGSGVYVWDATATDGRYAFTIYGNDGFVRSFAGQIEPVGVKDVGIPVVDVALVRGASASVRLSLGNEGAEPVRYQLVANDHDGGSRTVHVKSGQTTVIEWPAKDGYYDVVLTADTGTGWTQRYAGRVATAGE
ncbi:alkaline phosphatase family protein [Microbacterium azadirachtae]|uniref:phospholipase C n=1 Tax=Microbacterium azadirachtae TaxID=582680 RepID=A0A1I6G8X6_9MICO|nr:alkaline phosphatase family protein [Microbacterium azadirachtae]SDL37752.1 phospholipase C [Microbacterium azadirachtae]SEF68740.1 phospholipase C [Microbacterium azadirachtae]SEF69400.1 phospholipase C [Microbacterium azadirachtae]SFR38581.1 phospholipase C [Microbacterium azadirachtae]